jgi:hypothetical protein
MAGRRVIRIARDFRACSCDACVALFVRSAEATQASQLQWREDYLEPARNPMRKRMYIKMSGVIRQNPRRPIGWLRRANYH